MVSSVTTAQQYGVNPFQQRTENNGQVRQDDRDADRLRAKESDANGRADGTKDLVSRSSNLQAAASQSGARGNQGSSSSSRGTLFDATV